MQQLQQSAISNNTKTKRPHKEDNYEGQLDWKTKQRHGKGLYRFSNKYFEYQGQYQHNVREGPGVLRLANGTKITANFKNGEIEGQTLVEFADGSKYQGGMSLGERNGEGQFISRFEKYKGGWKDNKKHGQGIHETTDYTAEGSFVNNQLDGQAKVTRWDGEFAGIFKKGKREGQGKLVDRTLGLEYEGNFADDAMNGQGKIRYLRSGYEYDGEFKSNKPVLLANEFEVRVGFLKTEQGGEKKRTELAPSKAFEYELEGDPFSLEIRSCYQGPPVLDEIQPTPEEIDKLVKAWQAENKKNKNPPPMPDFNEPRMKKPELVVVQAESNRLISVELYQVAQTEGTQDKKMQIDFRQQIAARREEIEKIKKEKKPEEEIDKKKAPKKEGKGAPEPELKVNLFKEDAPDSTKVLKVRNQKGSAQILDLELPDDFPTGKYYLLISSLAKQYPIPAAKIELLINPKGTALAKNVKKK